MRFCVMLYWFLLMSCVAAAPVSSFCFQFTSCCIFFLDCSHWDSWYSSAIFRSFWNWGKWNNLNIHNKKKQSWSICHPSNVFDNFLEYSIDYISIWTRVGFFLIAQVYARMFPDNPCVRMPSVCLPGECALFSPTHAYRSWSAFLNIYGVKIEYTCIEEPCKSGAPFQKVSEIWWCISIQIAK